MLQRENLALTAALHFVLSPEQIIARLSGRRACPGCKRIFHVVMQPPRANGICDYCGSALVQREDDQPESIRVRMQAYEQSASPLLNFYQKQGLMISIDADGSPVETCQYAIASLASLVLAIPRA
jgi:adenylate kinase